jgi:hypothetical protein
MIQTLNFTTFANAFQNSSRADQFSYEALELIFDYIEDYERDTGEKVEFDLIALCCEWAEDTPEEIAAAYDIDVEGMGGSKLLMHVFDCLENKTQIAGVTEKNTIVYVQF